MNSRAGNMADMSRNIGRGKREKKNEKSIQNVQGKGIKIVRSSTTHNRAHTSFLSHKPDHLSVNRHYLMQRQKMTKYQRSGQLVYSSNAHNVVKTEGTTLPSVISELEVEESVVSSCGNAAILTTEEVKGPPKLEQ